MRVGGQGGTAADSDAALPTQELLVAAVGRALANLKANCSFDEFVTGTRTMLTFVGNCVKDPSNPKCDLPLSLTLTRASLSVILRCQHVSGRRQVRGGGRSGHRP